MINNMLLLSLKTSGFIKTTSIKNKNKQNLRTHEITHLLNEAIVFSRGELSVHDYDAIPVGSRGLWLTIGPFILLLGTVGNTMTIIVMSEKNLRKTAFGMYLIAISITDLIFIWIGLSRYFIKNYFNVSRFRIVYK